MNIYEKLMNIQQELKSPKGQMNKFGGYKYRSCEDILQAVKPLLKTNKVVLLLNDTLEYIGERYYIKATAVFKDVESNEEITNVAYAREEETKKGMDGSQITGASSSYARKYALNGLFGIDDVKDSDSTNDNGRISLQELSELQTLIVETETDIDKVKETYKVEDLADLTSKQYIQVKAVLEKRKNEKRINK